MELKFKGDGDRPKLPTLRQLLALIDEAEANGTRHVESRRHVLPMKQTVAVPPSSTFIYDGYLYAIVTGVGGNLTLDTQPGFHPCLNLKSQTIRAIDLNRQVEPIPVEVHVPTEKTHRYSHV